MKSLILTVTGRLVSSLMLVLSIYLLYRGHNLPGGGFIGGLVAATAFVLREMTDGVAAARRSLIIDPRPLAMLGVSVAVIASLASAFAGAPFLTGLWTFPGGIPLGTPLLFDIGVYLAVIGAVLTIVFALEEVD